MEDQRKPLTIISVDPGKMSGVAVWQETAEEQFKALELNEDQFYDFIHTFIHERHQAGDDVRLVAESFIITINTAKNTQSAWSLEHIGVLKFLAYRYGLPRLVLQAPNVGKTFGTNGKLKLLNWRRRGTFDGVHYAGHADDASRHLMTYAASRGLIFSEDQLIQMADV